MVNDSNVIKTKSDLLDDIFRVSDSLCASKLLENQTGLKMLGELFQSISHQTAHALTPTSKLAANHDRSCRRKEE